MGSAAQITPYEICFRLRPFFWKMAAGDQYVGLVYDPKSNPNSSTNHVADVKTPSENNDAVVALLSSDIFRHSGGRWKYSEE
jgi:hypothetical protein